MLSVPDLSVVALVNEFYLDVNALGIRIKQGKQFREQEDNVQQRPCYTLLHAIAMRR